MSDSILNLPEIFYGGDYNPEQWPEEVWLEDARLMQEAGVNLVSVGIFGWSLLEPAPGCYQFGWLDRVLDLLHQHGIKACLATATAAPPPWFAKLHPESLPVTKEGVRLGIGSRQHYGPSSPAYREAAARLVRQIATRYKDHPALAIWHINNEYGCHIYEDFSEDSAQAFRGWLERKYGSLEALNEAWGTSFWSQRYYAWEELEPPRAAPTFLNPTQQLDWRRFCSDALLGLCQMERQILQEITPHIPATTNFIGIHKPLDEWHWAEALDIVSNDSYPDPSSPQAAMDAALQSDLMRSLKQAPWILMEQAPNQVQWREYNRLKPPGVMRLWSLQALGRGARGLMFFQWRQSRAGAEKFHSGMLPHGGQQSRTWREIKALGNELKALGPVLETRVQAEAAILFDWDNWWALELDARPSAGLRLMEQVRAHYQALWRRNITVDFARPSQDLSGYKLVLVPNLYLVQDQAAANLEGYVAGGGTLLMSFFSGIVDPHDQVRLGGYPAPFRKLLGLWEEEFDALMPGHTLEVHTPDGQRFSSDLWAEVIHLEGAKTLATFAGGFYSGNPAITQHSFGQGTAYYVGTRLEAAGLDWLLRLATQQAGVKPVLQTAPGVEAIRRVGPKGSLLVLLNHGDQAVEVELESPARPLSSEQKSQRVRLESKQVVFLQED